MALPSGISTCTVTVGSAVDFFGGNATISVQVRPVLGGNAKRITWAATGQPLTSFSGIFTGEAGAPATFTLPHVDQAGFKDGAGNAFSGWSYLATVTITNPTTGETVTYDQAFQIFAGQTTVDLDLVPDGTIGSPTSAPSAAVTSVNGQTGAAVVGLADVAATATTAGALVVGKTNPVDATAGPLTMTLAAAPGAGRDVAVSKVDASTNTVTISVANLRGTAGTLTLVGQYETLRLTSKADGSWWVVGDHRTKTWLDKTYSQTKVSQTVVNVAGYDIVGNGSTDNTASINALLTSLAGASATLYFPPGVYRTAGGHVVPSGTKVSVLGAGKASTIIEVPSGTSDAFTFNQQSTGVRSLTIQSVAGSHFGGDGVVLNAQYTYADDFEMWRLGGNGVTAGKAGPAIGHRISNGFTRYCQGRGVEAIGASGATDGVWENLDLGNSGLAGAKASAAGQLMTNVHAWGSGLLGTSENYGIWVNSPNQHLVNCEPESNLGHGFFVNSTGTNRVSFSNCYSWANCGTGLYALNAAKGVITGCSFFDNGITNVGGAASSSFAGIKMEGVSEWTLVGNTIFDQGAAYPAGSYSESVAASFPGRSAIQTQSYAYAEVGSVSYNLLTGNHMLKQRTRSGTSKLIVSTTNRYSGNIEDQIAAPGEVFVGPTAPTPANPSIWFDTSGAPVITIKYGV